MKFGALLAALGDTSERPIRALVADHQSAARGLLKTVLRGEGMSIRTARTAEDALDEARSHPFDVLLLDRELPGSGGAGVLRTLRREGLETPALMLITSPAAPEIKEALDADAADYLGKPFQGVSHIGARAKLVAQQTLTSRFYDQLSSGIARALGEEGPRAKVFIRALSSLQKTSTRLAKRTSVLLLNEQTKGLAPLLKRFESSGLTVETASEGDSALRRLAQPAGPLMLLVDLRVRDALVLVERAARVKGLPVLVMGPRDQLEGALEAVSRGAMDYCLAHEGVELLIRRIKRAVSQACRSHLHEEACRQAPAGGKSSRDPGGLDHDDEMPTQWQTTPVPGTAGSLDPNVTPTDPGTPPGGEG